MLTLVAATLAITASPKGSQPYLDFHDLKRQNETITYDYKLSFSQFAKSGTKHLIGLAQGLDASRQVIHPEGNTVTYFTILDQKVLRADARSKLAFKVQGAAVGKVQRVETRPDGSLVSRTDTDEEGLDFKTPKGRLSPGASWQGTFWFGPAGRPATIRLSGFAKLQGKLCALIEMDATLKELVFNKPFVSKIHASEWIRLDTGSMLKAIVSQEMFQGNRHTMLERSRIARN